MKYEVRVSSAGAQNLNLPSLVPGVTVEAMIDGEVFQVRLVEHANGTVDLEVDGRRFRFDTHSVHPTQTVLLGANRSYPIEVRSELDEVSRQTRSASSTGPTVLQSQLPGVVRQVFVKAGDTVETGQSVLTLEAMKMENEIRAEVGGRVEEVLVKAGQVVATREDLVRIVPRS